MTEKKYKTFYSPNVMMATREAIDAIGGFDESYYIMFEEADFGYRIVEAGFKAYIVTAARTKHMGYLGDGQVSKLRSLGMETPERAYHFAKNRSVFMKRHAKWYHMISYYIVFLPLFTVYYSWIATRCGRKDIAKAWIKGSWDGIWIKTVKTLKVNI